MGVLDFDLSPIITPLIKALFEPFHLQESVGNTYTISQCTKDGSYDWQNFLVSLSVSFGLSVSDDYNFDDDLRAVGRHLGVDLEWLVTAIEDPFTDVRLSDLFRIAREANDGHNLVSIKIQTANHANEPVPDSFGGYGYFGGQRFSGSVDTLCQSAIGAEVDSALEDSAQAAATLIRKEVEGLLDGIRDAAIRADVTALVLAAETVTICEEDQKRFTRKDWRFEVSVGETFDSYHDWVLLELESENAKGEGCKPTEADMETWPLSDWQYLVANGDTRLGYDAWLTHQIEVAASDSAIRL